MRRRKKILVGLALVLGVAAAWFAVQWMMRPAPEMRPDFTVDPGDGVTLKMIWIPGGTFEMGSEPPMYERWKRRVASWFGISTVFPNFWESPVHEVSLDGFWMGKYEVTQEQYKAVTAQNPSYFRGADRPVERVDWHEAVEFCRRLSEMTGMALALPSEAQWEYACRAGSTGKFRFDDSESQLGEYAWFRQNSGMETHPVGGKKPNAWGRYDMYGNVAEWCLDHKKNRREDSSTDFSPVRAADQRLGRRTRMWMSRPW